MISATGSTRAGQYVGIVNASICHTVSILLIEVSQIGLYFVIDHLLMTRGK